MGDQTEPVAGALVLADLETAAPDEAVTILARFAAVRCMGAAAMCAHFEAVKLAGFAHWMKMQAQEEVAHAMRLFEFVHDRGARVTLQAISQPPTRFESPLSVFEQALEHERHITGLIDECYARRGRRATRPRRSCCSGS